MPWTKYAEPNASQNMTGLIQYTQDVSGGMFLSLILFALFVVAFMTSYRYTNDMKKSFIVGAWMSAIPAMLFFAGGWIPGTHALAFIIVLVIGIVVQFLD
jgi:hypothetical protein